VNQFGRGHGRDAATVIGALGGAVAGNQIGQQMGAQQAPSSYRVDVQVSDGSTRAFDVPTPGDLRPGDRVRIDGSQLSRY
ncbi:glycine zipper 2TM domain-containing protein, partial [Burkholderia ubonensis]|uniref:glycine zipper 2TM domain-containing protein n=1 Tax=Burkholderia ubonensis TaxID=101571 RepID=UPI00016A3708